MMILNKTNPKADSDLESNSEMDHEIKKLIKAVFWSKSGVFSLTTSIVLGLLFFFCNNEIILLILKSLLGFLLLALTLGLCSYLLSVIKNDKKQLLSTINREREAVKSEKKRLESIQNDISDQLKVFKSFTSEELSKLETCPRLTAFHTDDQSLEKKMDAMDKLRPNQRWMMSKFISELLSSNFASFSVEMETLQYSQFSIKIIKECNESVHLTGSMRPSTWLNGLVDEKNKEMDAKRVKFFNHLLPSSESFPIDENNHSVYISTCDFIKKRERIVCLSPEDMEYLFISEKSVDAYFKINHQEDGIHTYFIEWTQSDSYKMNPFVYEYALYDDVLLFKYDKKSTKLTILNGNSEYETPDNKLEFKEVKNFFNRYLKDGSGKLSYTDLKQRIIERKLELLEEINKDKRLIHKYSYLYSGGQRWKNYLKRESLRYGSPTTTAIALLLDWAFLEESELESQQYDIVEIGPGEGGRIFTVCDSLGTARIKNYTLVDISKRLLDISEAVLLKRLNDKNKCHIFELDCCSEKEETKERFKNLIKDKTVLILSNTTLFTEPKFEWESLKGAKQTFITVDLYDDAHKPFDDLMKAWPLFLLPLKIFEIPIIKEVIEKFMPYIFTDAYDNTTYRYNIYLNLKAYIELIARKKISGEDITPENIASSLNVDSKVYAEVVEKIKQLWNKDLKDVNFVISFDEDEYGEKKKQLFENNALMVLSCLKFKKEDDVESKIRTFIHNKGFQRGEGYEVDVSVQNDKFVGVLIKKTQQTSRRNVRKRVKSK